MLRILYPPVRTYLLKRIGKMIGAFAFFPLFYCFELMNIDNQIFFEQQVLEFSVL